MATPKYLICNGEELPCTGMEHRDGYIEYSVNGPSVTDGISTKEVKRRLKSLRAITGREE